jgi:sulfopyruvate decarboxylase subunit alpha
MLVFQALKKVGIDFVVYVPCSSLNVVVELAKENNEITCVLANREEEGIGIAVGAYLGGKNPCAIIQSSGLGNSVNALASLVLAYKVPLLLVIDHRGIGSEKIEAQKPMGKSLPEILDAIKIPFLIPPSSEEIGKTIKEIFEISRTTSLPVAILFNAELMGWTRL